MPELLTSTSKIPPVEAFTVDTAFLIDSSLVTSSCTISMPMSLRCWILAVFRALAKTLRPFLWKVFARASPIPPSLQPVMKTVFWPIFAMRKLFWWWRRAWAAETCLVSKGIIQVMFKLEEALELKIYDKRRLAIMSSSVPHEYSKGH